MKLLQHLLAQKAIFLCRVAVRQMEVEFEKIWTKFEAQVRSVSKSQEIFFFASSPANL